VSGQWGGANGKRVVWRTAQHTQYAQHAQHTQHAQHAQHTQYAQYAQYVQHAQHAQHFSSQTSTGLVRSFTHSGPRASRTRACHAQGARRARAGSGGNTHKLAVNSLL